MASVARSRAGRSARRVGAAMMVAGLSVVALAGPALAKGEKYRWPTTGTLGVYSDGKILGDGYGAWWVGDTPSGTLSQSDTYWRELNTKPNDSTRDRGTYVIFETWTNAGYCVQPDWTSCTAQYFRYAGTQSARDENSAWSHAILSTPVNPSADYARGHFRVGKDINNRTDPISGEIITHATTY